MVTVRRQTRSLSLATLFFICALSVAAQAEAALIGITAGAKPDIFSSSIMVDYVYDSVTDEGSFEAHGIATSYEDSGGLESISPPAGGTFDLSIKVKSSGAVLPGGTLTIGGALSGAPGPLLLAGTIKAFGFTTVPGENIFDFRFDVTGGDLADEMGPEVGTILTSFTGFFTGSLEDDFHSFIPSAVADTFPTPEPTSVITWATLCAIGITFSCYRRSIAKTTRT